MRTLSSNKRNKGFSLFELLIVVFLLSTIAGLSLIAVQPAMGSAKFKYACAILLSDLKKARLQSQLHGSSVTIELTRAGYSIPVLDVQRKFAGDLYIDIEKTETLRFSANGLAQGKMFKLRNNGHSATFAIEPLSGKITSDVST